MSDYSARPAIITHTSLGTVNPVVNIDTYSIDNLDKGFYTIRVRATSANGLVDSSLTFTIEIRWFVVITPPFVTRQIFLVPDLDDAPIDVPLATTVTDVDYFIPSPTDFAEVWVYTVTERFGALLPSFMV